MNNFIFENKTKVYFGKGCVGEYLPKIAAVHGDKVLLVYGGGSIKKNGVYEEVIAALEKAGKTNFRGSWKIRLIRRCLKAQSW